MKIIIFIIFSILFSQSNITTKEINIYKDNDMQYINLNDYFNDLSGTYIVNFLPIKDLNYIERKKILIQPCEFKINISTDISNDKVDIALCDGKFNNNSILVNGNNPIIRINSEKYSHFTCTFTIWISGFFIESNIISKENDGILREWHDNENLFIEYNYAIIPSLISLMIRGKNVKSYLFSEPNKFGVEMGIKYNINY